MICFFQFVRSILENELQKDAAEDGNAVKYAQNGKVFFIRNIRFKEQQQCHTGAVSYTHLYPAEQRLMGGISLSIMCANRIS